MNAVDSLIEKTLEKKNFEISSSINVKTAKHKFLEDTEKNNEGYAKSMIHFNVLNSLPSYLLESICIIGVLFVSSLGISISSMPFSGRCIFKAELYFAVISEKGSEPTKRFVIEKCFAK